MGIPQVTIGFNTESWSNDLGMIWASILGNPPIMGISEEYSGDDIVASPKTKKCFQNGNDRIYPIFSGLPSFLSIYIYIYMYIYMYVCPCLESLSWFMTILSRVSGRKCFGLGFFQAKTRASHCTFQTQQGSWGCNQTQDGYTMSGQ